VHHRRHVRVVEIESVDQRCVHGGRVTQRELLRQADQRDVTATAERAQTGKHPLREGVAPRRERDPDRVHDQMFGTLADLLRHVLQTQREREVRQHSGR